MVSGGDHGSWLVLPALTHMASQLVLGQAGLMT